MRVLVLSNEVWNDKINGNNVTSNWFEGMEVELANIYGSHGSPCNKCCTKYFQITDTMMLRSIFTGEKAGKRFEIYDSEEKNIESAEEEPERLYCFLKQISGSFLRLARELIWLWGKYDLDGMKAFIDEFQPDVVFSERMASVKMLRMEKIVNRLTNAPLIAFTGDDEYSLRQISFSPFFWLNRFMVRHRLRDMVKKYVIYYTLSYEQKKDYENRFGCNMKILQKCGSFEKKYTPRMVHDPIRIIYAGKLYLKRWKVLVEVVEVLKELNKNHVKAILQIYTADKLTKKQKKLLDDQRNSFIIGRVSQEKLKMVYENADIALHVESRNRKYALLSRLSFSTKIIDCIFSGCAVLAYCRKDQSGWLHLKRENAAMCVADYQGLREELQTVCSTPQILQKYAQQAYECGLRCHDRTTVQKMMLNDFETVIAKV